uniref:Uncharacterized protein n=1 Tax=Oryza brachyantha TaxID=4533 RepID=J3LPX9_ORYBR
MAWRGGTVEDGRDGTAAVVRDKARACCWRKMTGLTGGPHLSVARRRRGRRSRLGASEVASGPWPSVGPEWEGGDPIGHPPFDRAHHLALRGPVELPKVDRPLVELPNVDRGLSNCQRLTGPLPSQSNDVVFDKHLWRACQTVLCSIGGLSNYGSSSDL